MDQNNTPKENMNPDKILEAKLAALKEQHDRLESTLHKIAKHVGLQLSD